MGKTNKAVNAPCNTSLSYTLPHLNSTVELIQSDATEDSWQPFANDLFQLEESKQHRFLKHLAFLKDAFEYQGSFIVRSTNNFPASCGLASSASSFAALTLCACKALSELTQKPSPTLEQIAHFAKMASGSAGRSCFEPWVLWQQDSLNKINLPYHDLIHRVILIERTEKKVSSSEAHQRVLSSPLFKTRPERAENRCKTLITALQQKDWQQSFEIVWQEFTDMHQLFKTADPSFEYMTNASRHCLDELRRFWQERGDGPLVTMDAGPNIHLLFRADQTAEAASLIHTLTMDSGYVCL